MAVHPIFRFDDITVPDLPLSDSGSGEASSGDDAADEPTRDDEKSVDDIDEPAAGDATSPGSRFAPKISEKTCMYEILLPYSVVCWNAALVFCLQFEV